MCTATYSAIPTAPIREEWHTRLTTPRCGGAGGPAGCEQSHAPPARRRRALHPIPEVALVPLCPHRPRGEPTPRRLRRTHGQRTDACAACQAAARPAPSAGVARGPRRPRRPRRASHLSQRVGRARASSGASARRAVHASRSLHSRADSPRAGVGEIEGKLLGLLANSFQMGAMGGHALTKINKQHENK